MEREQYQFYRKALLYTSALSMTATGDSNGLLAAGGLALVLGISTWIIYSSDKKTHIQNQIRLRKTYADGQELLAPDKDKPIWQIPNGVMAKHDYKQLRKKHPDASHDQLVAYIGEHGKSHLFD